MEAKTPFLYLFCIINSGEKIDIMDRCFTGEEVYGIPYKDISIVVSNCYNESYEQRLEYLEGHEEIIKSLMQNYVVLPIKFSTVCSGKEKAIEIMTQYYKQIKDIIPAIENKVEMGVKVFCDIERIVLKYGSESNIICENKSDAQTYIMQKYNEYKKKNDALEHVKSGLRNMHEQLKQISVKYKVNKMRNENIILNSAYLIEKDKKEEFKRIVDSFKSTNEDYAIIMSGPWAPYNFVTLKKEGDIDG